MVARFNLNVDQSIQMDGTMKVVWYPSREGEWVRYADYADRIAELEAGSDRTGKHYGLYGTACFYTGQLDAGPCWKCQIKKLEATLDAVQPLPDKWRKYTFDNPEATSYIDSADCADELEEALGEVK